MKTEDILYCQNLLFGLAEDIKKDFRIKTHSKDLESQFKRFNTINDRAKSILEKALTDYFTDTLWSDHEFDEEKQHHPDFKKDYWICDSIDGAIHFLQGICPWCMTITLMRMSEPLFTMVYEPAAQEFFYAVKDQGAYLNGEKLNVSTKHFLGHAILGTSHPNNLAGDVIHTGLFLKGVKRIARSVFFFSMLGPSSLQLAYVACGRLDGYFEYGSDIYDWLGGALLVCEAGGSITDAAGRNLQFNRNGIVAANPILSKKLLKCICE
ncbi:inositol monophosphatase family protein [Pedobacter nutrimenti]|jgi:myo-inositol-1(or 4)-monophosphatase|uniref:Myo-inositol-1(Or 4)-monophosphatase n=1 Tax=Pedobacter nutrimenti TaxID=1241337 RepID=A0A318UMK0_9SPHI|nr:inositol monophosphatase family protein [Pedobacter nutrimenti]PYF77001.1 myo-inositol-1(or 4)-monophosphatase [Pedobacter nutrimenti]